jgi:hypothetical protein
MKRLLAALALLPALACADPAADIQRALIQRDRQSAEFARPELRDLHLEQDRQALMRPDERAAQARERDAYLLREREAPAVPPVPDRPLPLPGGPRHGVDPIPVQGVGG